jgi:hypothetical protein
MARYRVLSWRGIPAQVKARDDAGGRMNRTLPDWFQQEIDRVAMRDGAAEADPYLEAWAWSDETERPGDAGSVVAAVIDELCDAWSRPRTDAADE